MRAGRRLGAVLALAAGALVGCGREAARPVEGGGFEPRPTRGYVLISIDTLRADHLGAYGYERDTSPFFDLLAATGTLFERAVVQYPSTLTSHMSIFTGLYPQEHQVLPPSTVLSERIETLPQLFHRAGFRTAGHTEGGFVAGGYGFDRGFESFTDYPHRADTDVQRTFNLGLRFLRGLGAEERFFLFLHTYAVHDPYEPPPAYRNLFWPGEPPETFDSRGEHLRQVNLGQRPVSTEAVRYFEAQYDASIRYVDDVLARFFGELERLGLRNDTTVVVTSDHGEEFLEHGKLAHIQVYPECLLVPLLIVHPDQPRGLRVPTPVESIDIAPTLLDLAGLTEVPRRSGRSLAPFVRGAGGADREAYAEVFEREAVRTLITAGEDARHQVLLFAPKRDPEGSWIQGSVAFDSERPVLAFEAQSFHRPREVTVEIDGRPGGRLELDTTWSPVRLELPGRGVRRVVLEADGCDSPRDLGVGADDRCLSFQLRGVEPRRVEVYDLRRDPAARRDLAARRPGLKGRLLDRLEARRFSPVAAAGWRELSPEEEATLRALGYLE